MENNTQQKVYRTIRDKGSVPSFQVKNLQDREPIIKAQTKSDLDGTWNQLLRGLLLLLILILTAFWIIYMIALLSGSFDNMFLYLDQYNNSYIDVNQASDKQ